MNCPYSLYVPPTLLQGTVPRLCYVENLLTYLPSFNDGTRLFRSSIAPQATLRPALREARLYPLWMACGVVQCKVCTCTCTVSFSTHAGTLIGCYSVIWSTSDALSSQHSWDQCTFHHPPQATTVTHFPSQSVKFTRHTIHTNPTIEHLDSPHSLTVSVSGVWSLQHSFTGHRTLHLETLLLKNVANFSDTPCTVLYSHFSTCT